MKGVKIEFFTLCMAFRKVIFFIYQKINSSDRVPLSSQAFKEYKFSHLFDEFDFYYQAYAEHSPDPSVKISACLPVFPSGCVDTSSQQHS